MVNYPATLTALSLNIQTTTLHITCLNTMGQSDCRNMPVTHYTLLLSVQGLEPPGPVDVGLMNTTVQEAVLQPPNVQTTLIRL